MLVKFLRIFALIIVHGMIYTHAQSAISINACDNISVNGYMVFGIGNDPTMVTGTDHNIACADAVRQYFRDTTGVYARRSLSMTNTGSGAATYNQVTGVFNIPNTTYTPYVPAIYDSVIRTLNSAFVVSSTKEAYLCYSVKISVAISLSLGAASSGRLTPQHKAPGGSYWINMPFIENSPTLTGLGILSVGLLQANTYQFNCFVPPGDSVKFTTSYTGTLGNVTFTLGYGQDRY